MEKAFSVLESPSILSVLHFCLLHKYLPVCADGPGTRHIQTFKLERGAASHSARDRNYLKHLQSFFKSPFLTWGSLLFLSVMFCVCKTRGLSRVLSLFFLFVFFLTVKTRMCLKKGEKRRLLRKYKCKKKISSGQCSCLM